jgi:1,4-alpha-glucan branching enzyme
LTKTQQTPAPAGYLTFTLHAHLPYVINHGTWPHGMEWLLEAAAETYLPLLRVLKNLERDQIRFNCNLSLSPILLEQLAHPLFIAEFPKYLNRKIIAAREDEAFFRQAGERDFAGTARFWYDFFSQTLGDFNALDRDIIRGFRHFNDIGLIDIITSSATHGYLPLLGTDESVRAQVRTAVATHMRHIGKHPKGIWAPECGYRPAGFWNYPVENADGNSSVPGFDRIGVEQALSESNIDFFVVDTHLIEECESIPSPQTGQPSDHTNGHNADQQNGAPQHSLYQPYYVGPYNGSETITVFPRDPRTGVQVWSGDMGYPGDDAYLDFHKKRWPGGHRYWRVTGPRVDTNDKQPYLPLQAAERVKAHATHFANLVYEALSSAFNDTVPPILCAPFDADLFGHWWFEGAQWLEAVARSFHDHNQNNAAGIELISCAQYLDRYPRAGSIAMHEGSWGTEGTHQVWMNPETSWTYTHIYPAEIYSREVCSAGRWRGSVVGQRIAQQLCRELLLLESSDWQSLITTGAARDYAEIRFLAHNDQFNDLKSIWQSFEAVGDLTSAQEARLAEIELRDNIFPDIDPGHWASGAKETRIESSIEAAV